MIKKFNLTEACQISLDLKKTLCSTVTKFQKIEIFESMDYGKMVFVDDLPQSSDVDERLFNEILAHCALSKIKAPKKIFIAGGGPGGILREALRYTSVEKVVLCDIDQVAVEFYREHLPDWNSTAYSDPRTQVVHCDAREFLTNSTEQFDCIIIDVPDPLEEGTTKQLFTQEFYQLCKSRLTPLGNLVTQSGRVSMGNNKYFSTIKNTLNSIFEETESYACYIPCYFEHWSFTVATQSKSSDFNLKNDIDVKYFSKKNILAWRDLCSFYESFYSDDLISTDERIFSIKELKNS